MNAPLVLTALFNGAWQGAVLCTVALFAFRLFRRLNATTMFAIWSVLLAIAVALPFANYAFATDPVTVHASATIETVPTVMLSPSKHTAPVTPVTRVMLSAPKPDTTQNLQHTAVAIFKYAPYILFVLAAIAFVRLTVLLRDVVRMLVARTRVRPIDAPVQLSGDIPRPYQFAASDDFTSPCVLGFAPALIVIPEELLAEHSSKLMSVVLHEREHVRRYDDIQNVLQRFIGAIAFFCPGVRIALRELALYREQICDDAAVNATGDRVSYAMTLTGLAQWAQGRGAPVPSLIFKRKHLLHRLEVLLDSAVSHSMRMNRRFALAAATSLLVAALIVLRIQVPVIAETLASPAVKAAPVIHAKSPPATRVAPVVPRKVAEHAAHVMPLVVPKAALAAAAKAAKVSPRVRKHVAPKVVRIAVHVEPALAPHSPYEAVAHSVAYAYAYRQTDAGIAIRRARAAAFSPVAAPVVIAQTTRTRSDDLLDALAAARLRDLSVDQLIRLRDHGVSADLIRSATSYFGHVSADDLVGLADHGVGPRYIDLLRENGVSGIDPEDAVQLMDHGVTAGLMRAAFDYFSPRPGVAQLIDLANHGVSPRFIESLRAVGSTRCAEDAIHLMDHGVDAAYVAKIRRMNPRATIAEIIRLHDSGF